MEDCEDEWMDNRYEQIRRLSRVQCLVLACSEDSVHVMKVRALCEVV